MATSVAAGFDVSAAVRIRSPNSVRAARSSRPISRASWPKPLTTRTPVTVSSTCWARSAARCWADHDAGNSTRLLRTATTATTGVTTSATRVNMGDSHNMAPSAASANTTVPIDSGTIISRPCTTCRSVIERDTIWPVRSVSCLAPSSRCTAANTCWRRSCWTSRASRPPR